jgi:hypothetical protein
MNLAYMAPAAHIKKLHSLFTKATALKTRQG